MPACVLNRVAFTYFEEIKKKKKRRHNERSDVFEEKCYLYHSFYETPFDISLIHYWMRCGPHFNLDPHSIQWWIGGMSKDVPQKE